MKLHLLALVLLLPGFAIAQSLQGTVTNGTTGKVAANAEVTLISLSSGMQEVAHTRTDASGRYTVTLSGETGTPHLVRVRHQDVNYFKMAPPGTNTADVQIYDVTRKLDGIATAVQIMRLQSDGNGLQMMELYAVRNTSNPARTLGGERTFEIALPEGAALDSASAKAPGGQPIKTAPEPVSGRSNQYAFSFPLRPGETQFEVAYHLPYSGQAMVKPVLLRDAQHFVAMLPKTMQFAPAGDAQFSPMPDEAAANVQVLTNARAGAPITFTVSGTGMLAEEGAPDGGNAQQAQAGGAMMGGRGPGGGIGNPIGSPDPLSRYRWPLLGGLTAVLAVGGVYMARRHSPAPAVAESAPVFSVSPVVNAFASDAPPARSLLLEAMKEELFQLEVERQQGRITQEEYDSAKAALDHTLKRALSRAS